MFRARFVSSSHTSQGVARMVSNSSARHSGGTSASNTSDSSEQNTNAGSPAASAFRFHANGRRSVEAAARTRGAPGPHPRSGWKRRSRASA